MVGKLAMILLLGVLSRGTGLERAVEVYWESLVHGQKSAALEFVHSASIGDFIDRKEPILRSWKLVGIELVSNSEALVTVQVERGIGGHFYRWQLSETWTVEQGVWKVRVKPGGKALRSLFLKNRKGSTFPGQLTVRPERFRIHFIGTSQADSVVISNGEEEQVRLSEVQVDVSRFRVREAFEVLAPGETGVVTLEYTGNESNKNLVDSATLLMASSDRKSSFKIPIDYNYVSTGTRGLFGLTGSDVRELKTRAQLVQHIRSHEIRVQKGSSTDGAN
jgi:hypothetical protein